MRIQTVIEQPRHSHEYNEGVRSTSIKLRDLAQVGFLIGNFSEPELQEAADAILALWERVQKTEKANVCSMASGF